MLQVYYIGIIEELYMYGIGIVLIDLYSRVIVLYRWRQSVILKNVNRFDDMGIVIGRCYMGR